MRRALLASILLLLASLARAQAPPPVPALPDTERRTTYSITASTCNCAINMQLYGDGTDYQDWIEVYLNGIRVNYNDPTFGWSISSPTGTFGSISLPITDAIFNFNTVQTGIVQIVGARRPRRVTEFNENAGVPARSLNQAFNDLTAMQRETWDKLNDVTGRAIISQPGNIMGPLPVPANCINSYLTFDATGLNPVCQGTNSIGLGNVFLAGQPVIGSPTGALTSGTASGNTTKFATVSGTLTNGHCVSIVSPGNFIDAGGACTTGGGGGTVSSGTEGQTAIYAATGSTVSGVTQCTPFESYGGSTANSGASNDTAINAIFTAFGTSGGCIQFGQGIYTFSTTENYTLSTGVQTGAYSLQLRGAGRDVTVLNWAAASALNVTLTDCQENSVSISDLTFGTGSAPVAGYKAVILTCNPGTANTVLGSTSVIQNVSFRDSAHYDTNEAWSVGVDVHGVNNINFIGLNYTGFGSTAGSSQGIGVALAGLPSSSSCSGGPCYGTIYNFFGCNFDYGNIGISYGSYVQGLSVTSSNFTGGNFGIAVSPSETGTLSQLTVTGSQFNTGNTGIITQTLTDDVLISNNFFVMSLATNVSGVLGILGGAAITGNQFFGNNTGTNGIIVSTGSLTVNITGNTFSGLTNGITVSNTANTVNVQSNSYISNTTNTTPSSSTGGVKIGGGSA